MKSTLSENNKKRNATESWIVQIAHEVSIDCASVSTCAVFESKSKKIIALDVARIYSSDKTKSFFNKIFKSSGLPNEIHIAYNALPQMMNFQKWCKEKGIVVKYLNVFNFEDEHLITCAKERAKKDIN